LELDRFVKEGGDSERRIETDVVVDLELDLARYAASNISHWNYDLRAVIHHRYIQLPKDKTSDQFSAFVRVRSSGGAQSEVWKDFSTQGEPNVDARQATRAHDGNLPYMQLYELRTTGIASKCGTTAEPTVVSDSPLGSPLKGSGTDEDLPNTLSTKRKRSQSPLPDNNDRFVALAAKLDVISKQQQNLDKRSRACSELVAKTLACQSGERVSFCLLSLLYGTLKFLHSSS
jgi:hypothetical protein